MFVVLFEVQPRADRWEEYLEVAGLLRPELESVDGFLENERFRNRRYPERLLSLSTWRNEKALIRWRTRGVHHHAQERGRFEIFADYALRVGEVIADSEAPRGESLRDDRRDLTETGEASFVSIIEWTDPLDAVNETRRHVPPNPAGFCDGLLRADLFDSITTADRSVWLLWWRDEPACHAGEAVALAAIRAPDSPASRRRSARIIRDYSLHDRAEAPQYYPPVE